MMCLYLVKMGGFSRDHVYYIRDGLLDEGWFYHQVRAEHYYRMFFHIHISLLMSPAQDLPPSWMYKQYNHKIEGVYTDILYILSPAGTIFRSKTKIKRHAEELGLTDYDLKLLLDFKSELYEPRKVEDPDSDWIYDEALMPKGWRRKKYCYNSGITKKMEEVFHYLTPDNYVLRGKKQVYDYMKKSHTFRLEEFEKFHFNRRQSEVGGKNKVSLRSRSRVDWDEWGEAADLGAGWLSRTCQYRSQRKVQYRSPDGKKFQSRVLALKYLNSGEADGDVGFHVKNRRSIKNKEVIRHRGTFENDGKYHPTIWGEWKSDEIPCLGGWQFSIGRRGSKRMIRYKSPKGNVFRSRGPLLRYLQNNRLKSKEQLAILKKQLKTNQGLHVTELLKNDKFIKNFDADTNYLEFLKIRYENESHQDIPEVIDPKLPPGWVKKNINGVDYFKDPTGHHVYNSRRLVVDHLQRNYYDMSREQLQTILDQSDSDSDLTDSEDTEEGDLEENNNENFEFVYC